MSDALEQWLRYYCYAPDDIVLGNQGLTESQLTAFHALLDIVAPGWREMFGE